VSGPNVHVTILAHFLCEGYGESDSRWLSFTRGDVLHTDRILLSARYTVAGNESKQMPDNYHKTLTVGHATLQNTHTLHIGPATALVVLDVRTS
jgi:hypothetical protein